MLEFKQRVYLNSFCCSRTLLFIPFAFIYKIGGLICHHDIKSTKLFYAGILNWIVYKSLIFRTSCAINCCLCCYSIQPVKFLTAHIHINRVCIGLEAHVNISVKSSLQNPLHIIHKLIYIKAETYILDLVYTSLIKAKGTKCDNLWSWIMIISERGRLCEIFFVMLFEYVLLQYQNVIC